jgi:hypothetical protein
MIAMLALTEPEKVLVDPHLEDILDKLAVSGFQRAAACRMLMARLAVEQKPAVAGAEGYDSTGGEERQHG